MKPRLRSVLVLTALLGLLIACGKTPKRATYWSQINDIGSWMTGAFRCEAPADAGEKPRAVNLDIIEFWPNHDDSGVLYAEWAYEDALGEPFRQRVFHILRFDDGSAALVVFDLKDPAAYAGAWRDPTHLATLEWDGLIEREACLIRLAREEEERFAGGSVETGCVGADPDGGYIHTELVVEPEKIVWSTWEVTEDGHAAPDAEVRADVFVKVTNRPFR